MIIASLQVFALEWHDELIDMMLQLPIRDKQIVVERDESTKKIKRASYSFSFVRDNVAKKIQDILFKHEKEASKFSVKEGEILMQIKEYPNTYYTYSFGKDPVIPGRYLLLISVKQGSFPKPENMSYFLNLP